MWGVERGFPHAGTGAGSAREGRIEAWYSWSSRYFLTKIEAGATLGASPSALNSAIIELMYGRCQGRDVMGVCGILSIPGRLEEAAAGC